MTHRITPHALVFVLGSLLSSSSIAAAPGPSSSDAARALAPATVRALLQKSVPDLPLASTATGETPQMTVAQARELQDSPARWAATLGVVSLLASSNSPSGSVYRPLPTPAADPSVGPWVARLYLASLDPSGVLLTRADVTSLTEGPANQAAWNAAVSGQSAASVLSAMTLYKARQKAALDKALGWIARKSIPYTTATWSPVRPVRLPTTPTHPALLASNMAATAPMDDLDRVGLRSTAWPVDPSADFAASVQDDWDALHVKFLYERQQHQELHPEKASLSDAAVADKAWAALKTSLTDQRDSVAAWTDESAVELFARTLVQSVDPHADYLAPQSAKRFDQMLMHVYTGIGAFWKQSAPEEASSAPSVQASGTPPAPDIAVERVLSGSPADQAGLKAGDILLGIGTSLSKLTPASQLRLNMLPRLSDGPVGAPVFLRIRGAHEPASAARTLSVLRQTVHLDDHVVTARWVDYTPPAAITDRPTAGVHGFGPRALVIQVPDFYRDGVRPNRPGGSVTDDIRAVLRAAESGPGCTGLNKAPRSAPPPVWSVAQSVGPCGLNLVVLDLRDNPGGLLTEAVRTAGLFVAQGPVVRLRTARGETTSYNLAHANVPVWNGPMVVLVNQNTASAAEIVAGALQDHHRAIVIGQPTYGKGSAQEVIDLDQLAGVPEGMGVLGQVHITGSAFFRPSGISPQRMGITPDVTLGIPTPRWAAVLNDDRVVSPEGHSYEDAVPRAWVQAAATLAHWRTSLGDTQFLAVRSAPTSEDREEGKFNALPSVRLPALPMPETSLAVGADPWIIHRAQLQERAQERWYQSEWSPWWMIVNQTDTTKPSLLNPTARARQGDDLSSAWASWKTLSHSVDADMHIRATVSASAPNIWTADVASPARKASGPSDVLLAAALGVASDAFGATEYPHPWLNTKEAAVPAWWSPPAVPVAGAAAQANPTEGQR